MLGGTVLNQWFGSILITDIMSWGAINTQSTVEKHELRDWVEWGASPTSDLGPSGVRVFSDQAVVCLLLSGRRAVRR